MKAKIMMVVFLSFLVLPIALAASLGHWWGRVYINGTQVPDGTTINAYINGNLIETTTVGKDTGSGYYVLVFEGTPGDTIIFKIGSIDAEQTNFSDGAHPQLDLKLAEPACGDDVCNGAESCSICSLDCGSCSSSSSSSSGGGGGSSSCKPEYVCRSISQCLPNGKEKQVCTDTACNKGSYQQTVSCTYIPPLTTQTSGNEGSETTEEDTTGGETNISKTEETTTEEKEGMFNAITGAVIGLVKGNTGIIFSIILALIIIGLYLYYNANKSKKLRDYFRIFERV